MIAACVAIPGLATVLFLLLDGRSIFRALVSIGALALAIFGVTAIKRILDAPHFEGFVLIIGLALIVQSVLTLGVILRTRHAQTP